MTSTPDNTVSHGLSGPALDPTPATLEVTRSEEQLQVDRTVRVSARAVLRKYVVTETVTQTFEVRHEEVRLDDEPVGSTDVPTVGEGLFDDRVIEMVLHREVPIVQLQVEATERVRLHIDTVTEQQPVSADVRKERLDVDTPDG